MQEHESAQPEFDGYEVNPFMRDHANGIIDPLGSAANARMLANARVQQSGEASRELSFAETPLAPEEFRGALAGTINALPKTTAIKLRKMYGIPAGDPDATPVNTEQPTIIFNESEADIASFLVAVAMEDPRVSNKTKKGQPIRPMDVWSPEAILSTTEDIKLFGRHLLSRQPDNDCTNVVSVVIEKVLTSMDQVYTEQNQLRIHGRIMIDKLRTKLL